MITKQILNEIFTYKNGSLIWAKQLSFRVWVGKKAGSTRKDGYGQVGINGVDYLLHKLIFMYHYGYMPKYIDHIDGNPLNNCIENLRECTNQQNSFNSKISKNNTSGIKGVTWDSSRSKWQAKCTLNNKTLHLGRFSDIKDAENAVKLARQTYHGQFARHQ
jgi:hypothetical protein